MKKERIKNRKEEALRKKAREISIKEGSLYSISDGMGMRYITPYALALGANNKHIGLLTSLPTLIGNFSKLLTPRFMEHHTRKEISILGAFFQAVMWLVVIFIGYLFFIKKIGFAPVILIPVYVILILFGAFYGPAWSSWMKDIVIAKDTGKYFGLRNKITGFFAVGSMLIAGFILDYFNKMDVFIGFIILFGIAFVTRMLTAYLFTKKYEPKLKLEEGYYFSIIQFIKRMPSNNFGRFVIFLALIQFATAIASPFIAVYMLDDLGFSYVTWIIVTISASLTSLLFLPLWGRFSDKYGNLKVMKITGFFIPIIPLLWLFSAVVSSYNLLLVYLIVIEAFGGFIWAGFNLSSSNFIYDAISKQRMALCVAYSDILNGVGVFLGASIGGFLSESSILSFMIKPLLFIFFLSFVMRLFVSLLFLPKIEEVRAVEHFGVKEAKRILVDGSGKILRNFEMITKPR